MAAAAKLFILAAGDPASVEACQPLFDSLGQKTSTIGPEPSAANLVKLTGNFLQAAVIEALGEAVALVGKAGIDRRDYVEVLTSTVFTAPAYKIFGPLIAEGRFEPAAFAAPLGAKDIRLLLAAAEELRAPMPLAGMLHDRFLRLSAQGGDKLDWSAIGGLAIALISHRRIVKAVAHDPTAGFDRWAYRFGDMFHSRGDMQHGLGARAPIDTAG